MSFSGDLPGSWVAFNVKSGLYRSCASGKSHVAKVGGIDSRPSSWSPAGHRLRAAPQEGSLIDVEVG